MEVANAIGEIEGGVSILVRAQPRASRSAIVGVTEARGGAALKIAVHAPPAFGAANEAIIALLAEELGVGKRSITIAQGEHGREKRVHVLGITLAEVLLRLGA